MAKFVPNRRFEAELKREAGVRAAIRARAEKAVRIADAAAPSSMQGDTFVEDTPDGVSAGSRNPFFHLAEWGSVNNPPQAPLRRAVRAQGLRFEETGP